MARMTRRQTEAIEAAKHTALDWNACDPPTHIPPEAAKQLALAALAAVERFDGPAPPEDGNHALLVGGVMGALAVLCGNPQIPTEVEPCVSPDGDYFDSVRIARGSGTYIVTIKKEED